MAENDPRKMRPQRPFLVITIGSVGISEALNNPAAESEKALESVLASPLRIEVVPRRRIAIF